LSGEAKRREERRSWAIYSRLWFGGGARVFGTGDRAAREESGVGRTAARGGGSWPVGPGRQQEKEEGHIPICGSGLAGPRPLLGLGQLVSPTALFIFFCSFIFIFLFSYLLLQNWFKSIQSNFYIFLKYNTKFKISKNTSFQYKQVFQEKF
jgi:hypothetical protein